MNKISLRKISDESKSKRTHELHSSEPINLSKSSKKRKKDKAAGLLMSIDRKSKKILHSQQTNQKPIQLNRSKNRKFHPKIVNTPKPSLLQLAKALKSNKSIQPNSNDKLRNLLG